MPDDDLDLDYGYSERPERRGLDELGGGDGRVEKPARKEPRDATRQMKQGAIEEVRDHQEPPVTRVRYGKVGDGVQDYGIEVYDASGNLVLSATGLGVDVVDTDQLQDGAVTNPKLGDGSVDLAKHAASLEPVDVVDSLPSPSGYSGPQAVLLTTDRKLYRYDPDVPEWTVAVPTGDLTGQIVETQISDDSISTPKLQAGAVTTAKINAGAVTASEIEANTITAGEVSAGAINTDELAADAVVASKISVGQLSEIADDAGIIVSGQLQNASGSRFIDLQASGSDPFIEHPALTLQADGDAAFSGDLDAASGTFSGSLSAASGTFAGDLSAAITQAQTLEVVADLEGDVSENVEVRLGADTFTFFDLTNNRTSLRIFPELNDRAAISPHKDLDLAPLTAPGRIRVDYGDALGRLPVGRVNVSTSGPPSSLSEGTLHIQVN